MAQVSDKALAALAKALPAEEPETEKDSDTVITVSLMLGGKDVGEITIDIGDVRTDKNKRPFLLGDLFIDLAGRRFQNRNVYLAKR